MITEITKIIKAEDLKHECYEIGRFTIVKLTTPLGLVGIGISRRTEDDKHSKIGRKIAYGRALKAIVKKLNKEKINHLFMG